MNVLGIYPTLGSGDKRSPKTKRYFPWGFATVLKCVEQSGHQTQVLDIYGNDLLKHEVIAELVNRKYDCVCISGFASYNYSYVKWLAEKIKEMSGVPVVVGGVLADHHSTLLLSDKNIDYCVIGEGEITVPELLRNLNHPELVPGIAYKSSILIKKTVQRDLIKDLDTLPMPDFDLWNMEPYLKSNLWADDTTTQYTKFENLPSYKDLHPNISLFFGRGCPYKCKFCSRSYQTMRHKSVDRIISEVSFLKEKFGVKAVHFYDELVLINHFLAIELAYKMKSAGVWWDCQGRVNQMDKDLMHILKACNCYSIGFGFESGSNNVLKAMNKGTTREQNDQVLQWAKETGMHLKIQVMCGYPGETEEDTMQTIEMMKQSGLPPRRLSWTTPLPGSELYHSCVVRSRNPDGGLYLTRLGKIPMNGDGGKIVLNVSGMPDDEMMDLYRRANALMEYNFKPSVKSWALSRKWLSKYLYAVRDVML